MLAALLDLLLPSLCPACRVAAGPGLCGDCRARIEQLDDPCAWCGAPDGGAATRCPSCDNRGIAHLRRVHVLHPYRGVVEHLVGEAKAGARPAAIAALEALMPLPEVAAGTVVIPLPPSPGRRPGPHLATALARALARRLCLRLARPLRPTRAAAEQHRLSWAERRRNVAGLFTCRGPAPTTVLLVDDLLTSRATASAAALALRTAGAMRIDLACLARTPRADE